jgi:aminopeptidase N
MTAAAAGSAFAIDPFFPTFGNLGIDVQHYNIDLDVDPVSGRIIGNTSLAIEAVKSLTSFSLDLHSLDVSQVRVNGRQAQFTQSKDKLTIKSFGTIAKGREFAVQVRYAGVPDPLADPTTPGALLGWFKYKNSSYVVSEPVGASTFFPANEDITDKATYTFGITVPFNYAGVANGAPVGRFNLGAKTRYQWAMLQPMQAWLATVHVNKFNVRTTRTSKGIPVRTYYPDGVPASHVDRYQLAAEMIPYFESKIGRYPFSSYGTVVTQDPALTYYLETQAISVFPAEAPDPAAPTDEGIVAHELVHQWFGNSVSVSRWEDLWFAEGLATYFEVLWPNRDDPAAFDAAMLEIYDSVVADEIGPAVVDAPDQLFSERTYNRGGSAIYALQLKVGQPMLFKILRRFLNQNRNGTITSADFINTAVKVSGDPSVRPLLRAWLYETPVPSLPGTAVAARATAKRAPAAKLAAARCGRSLHRGAPQECAPTN